MTTLTVTVTVTVVAAAATTEYFNIWRQHIFNLTSYTRY
jgi:hypothetical protein